jgi:hypothetical protein
MQLAPHQPPCLAPLPLSVPAADNLFSPIPLLEEGDFLRLPFPQPTHPHRQIQHLRYVVNFARGCMTVSNNHTVFVWTTDRAQGKVCNTVVLSLGFRVCNTVVLSLGFRVCNTVVLICLERTAIVPQKGNIRGSEKCYIRALLNRRASVKDFNLSTLLPCLY